LKLDPNNGVALRGLGYANLLKLDLEKAEEYFRRAKERSHDPRVIYYSALLTQREGGRGFRNDDGQLETMQKELEGAIQLDPDFADAYNVLAFTYTMQRKHDQAAAALTKAIQLSPQNEEYRFNLAHVYMQKESFDSATAILKDLQTSDNPIVVARSSDELAQVETLREEARLAAQPSPREIAGQPSPTETPSEVPSAAPSSESPKVGGPARFLKGKLLSVDCSAPPAATLVIVAGPNTWQMRAANASTTIVIGADKISCDWKNQKVAVNYRQTGDRQGDIISLELQ